MKVKELILELEKMPQDVDVGHLWDGEVRTNIEHVWLSKNGDVVTADNGMACYSTGSRPADAPNKEDDRYWKSPGGDD